MSDRHHKIAVLISKVYTDLMSAENEKIQIDNELAKITAYKVGQIVRIDVKEK